jgi:hypothetical protein
MRERTVKCLTSIGACIKCTEKADCDTAYTAAAGYKCDTTSNTCKQCTADADCTAGIGNTGKCSAAGTCLKCTEQADCDTAYTAAAGYKCNTTTNACVKCLADADCTAGTGNTGKCLTTGAAAGSCLKCESNADCDAAFTAGTKKCNTTINVCVDCLENGDCTAGTANTGKCFKTSGICNACDAKSDCDTAFGTTPIDYTCE